MAYKHVKKNTNFTTRQYKFLKDAIFAHRLAKIKELGKLPKPIKTAVGQC